MPKRYLCDPAENRIPTVTGYPQNIDMRLLVVEDDPQLGLGLVEDLSNRGFSVDLATDGHEAEFKGSTEIYDLIVLDLGLPGIPGLEILARWRASGVSVPIIILTARAAWHERVDGFKAGADDYLGKPFHSEELFARINAILKRAHGHSPGPLLIEGIELDEGMQRIRVANGDWIELSGTEFRMMRAFMLHPGQVLSKTHLSEHLFRSDSEPDSNIIEVYITKLRQKIGHERIQTRRGQGYVLIQPPSQ